MAGDQRRGAGMPSRKPGKCVHIALLGHDLITRLLVLLLECLHRCRSNSRPKARKSITTCSHTKTRTAKATATGGVKTGSEDSVEKERKETELPMKRMY